MGKPVSHVFAHPEPTELVQKECLTFVHTVTAQELPQMTGLAPVFNLACLSLTSKPDSIHWVNAMGSVFVSTRTLKQSLKSRNQPSLVQRKCLHIVTTKSSNINTVIHCLADFFYILLLHDKLTRMGFDRRPWQIKPEYSITLL